MLIKFFQPSVLNLLWISGHNPIISKSLWLRYLFGPIRSDFRVFTLILMRALVNRRRGWRVEAPKDDKPTYEGGSALGTCKGCEEEGKFHWARCFVHLQGGEDILGEISAK